MRIYETTLQFSLVQLGETVRLDSAAQLVDYVRSGIERNPVQESFWLIALDKRRQPICRHMLTLGTQTAALVNVRDVIRVAILANAVSVAIAHNHPSGDPAPSSADLQVTRQVNQGCRAVDLELIDHVILGNPESDPAKLGYYSFRNAGLL